MEIQNKGIIIAIDFDGSCVTHDYPRIGKDIGAQKVLTKIISSGHMLILNTMRSDIYLDDALRWFDVNKIQLWGINTNPTQKLWTSSPKVLADLYIDDAAFNAPLIYDKSISTRPFLDWNYIEIKLMMQNIINK